MSEKYTGDNCPFCGSKDLCEDEFDSTGDRLEYDYHCEACSLMFRVTWIPAYAVAIDETGYAAGRTVPIGGRLLNRANPGGAVMTAEGAGRLSFEVWWEQWRREHQWQVDHPLGANPQWVARNAYHARDQELDALREDNQRLREAEEVSLEEAQWLVMGLSRPLKELYEKGYRLVKPLTPPEEVEQDG